jgi:flavin reductase (DIM6/NTAB) family NADH-FMN oxidoreductase RutF
VDVRRTFDAIVGHLEYSMFIVTARADDEPLGCLVGFATQTSIDPQRFLVCLSRTNRTHRLGHDAELLGVHAVPGDAGDLAELFGGTTGDEVDKFALVDWHEEAGGVPMLDRCENRFVGRVLARTDAGDHEAFLLEPIAAHSSPRDEDFTFHRAKRIEPGHPA